MGLPRIGHEQHLSTHKPYESGFWANSWWCGKMIKICLLASEGS